MNVEAPVAGAEKRVVSLKGTIPAITAALRTIVEKLSARYNEESKSETTDSNDENQASLTLLVSQSAVGSLIGPAGATINATRQATRASIKISSQPLEQSTEKTVVVQGTASAVMTAVTHILTQLLSNVIATGGANNALRQLQPKVAYEPSAALGSVPGSALFSPQAPLRGHGANNSSLLSALMSNRGGSNDNPLTHQHQSVISVPDSAIGAIIGRGGATISEIRSVTHCDIRVPSKSDGEEDGQFSGSRNITITGSQIGVAMATTVINELLNKHQSTQGNGSSTSGSSSNGSNTVSGSAGKGKRV